MIGIHNEKIINDRAIGFSSLGCGLFSNEHRRDDEDARKCSCRGQTRFS